MTLRRFTRSSTASHTWARSAEPADRHALRLAALSYAGTLRIGICTDPTHLHGLDRLAAGLDRSFDELLA